MSAARQRDAPPEPVLRQVPAVTRAAAIPKLLARSEALLGVRAIARALGLVPSTCLHILRALVAEELLAFDPAPERRFAALRWENPPTRAQWRADAARTARAARAVDEGRSIAGVSILAAPVMPRGRLSHALVVGVGEQPRRAGLATLGAELRAEAEALSRRMEGAA